MKKLFSIILLICFCLGAFASCKKQEKANDSLNLPEKVYSDFEMSSESSILKISTADIADLFDKERDVKADFDESNYMQGIYYELPAGKTVGNLNCYDEDGKISYLTGYSPEESYDYFFEYAMYPEKVLGYFVRVENVYCYTYAWWDWWIYYEAKDGTDYVLFKEYDVAEKMYLFTVEELKPIAKALEEKRKRYSLQDGLYLLSSVADISEYEITPSERSRDELVDIAVCAGSVCAINAIIVTTSIVVVKKRKGKQAE